MEWQAKRVPFHDFDWEHAVGTKLHAEGLERGDSKFTAAEVRERTDKAAKQVVDDLYKVHKVRFCPVPTVGYF